MAKPKIWFDESYSIVRAIWETFNDADAIEYRALAEITNRVNQALLTRMACLGDEIWYTTPAGIVWAAHRLSLISQDEREELCRMVKRERRKNARNETIVGVNGIDICMPLY